VNEVQIVVAHQERVTMRVGDLFLKVDGDDDRLDREIAAMHAVDVPTATVLWREQHVLALAALPGAELGRLGEPSSASREAWAAAGAMARRLHCLPLPPWTGWSVDDFVAHIDHDCRWLVDNGIAAVDVVERARARADAALRPFPLVFTHGDLQAAHVFVEGDVVTGIIDWADAVQGDALFDLAVLTVGHEEHLDDVVRGYGVDIDLGVVRGWWAVRRILAVRWMVEHGFDAAGDIAALAHTTR
jgi:aminoglycoside phosphotransferase (APT) family kinase protein